MTRKEFVKFTQTRKSKGKQPLITGKSITDPTFARTGRQMIFDPLNIEYRMKYPDGNPLNPDNPHDFKEYDKLYPDQFIAMRQAKQEVKDTKTKLNKMKQEPKQEPKQQPNQPIV